MSLPHYHISFEERFKAFVPDGTRVSNSIQKELEIHTHDDTGIFIKGIAYLLDIGLSVFILPIFYNIYHSLRRGQTLGQWCMGIRVYRYHHVGLIATIPQLIHRFIIKFLFFALWIIIGINIASLWFGPYLESQSTYWIFHSIYIIFMLVWIHGYALTMITNKHRRGLHDIWSGTVVAYDQGHQIKRIILGIIGCVILYYIIFGLSPSILSFADSHLHGEREQSYRAVRSWIDHRVLTGISTINLE